MPNEHTMKTIVTALFLSFTCFSAQSQEFDISFDTVPVSIKGDLRDAVFYNNKYYGFFETDNHQYSTLNSKHFYILSGKGEVVEKIPVNDGMNAFNYSVFQRNDSIIYTSHNREASFYLDEKKKEWAKLQSPNDVVFEDEQYTVYHLDFGEWGACLWFKDKKTGVEYECAADTSHIIKLNAIYYLVSGDMIIAIENPAALSAASSKTTYEETKKMNKVYKAPVKGLKVVYKGEYHSINPTGYITRSFIYNNRLYHIYIDGEKAYVAELKNGKLEKLQYLADDIYMENDEDVYSIVAVESNRIKVRYLKNNYKERVLTDSGEKKIFTDIIDHAFEKKGNIFLDEVVKIEQEAGAGDLTQKHKMSVSESIYPNTQLFELETPRIYHKKSDLGISADSKYYYTKADKSVKLIGVSWKKINKSNTGVLDHKFDEVLQYLIGKAGKPTVLDTENKIAEWQNKDGFVIRLMKFRNDSELAFWIYKQ